MLKVWMKDLIEGFTLKCQLLKLKSKHAVFFNKINISPSLASSYLRVCFPAIGDSSFSLVEENLILLKFHSFEPMIWTSCIINHLVMHVFTGLRS